MNLPTLGKSEKTEASRYQITLVDKTDRTRHPINHPRINRFFETIEERNQFVMEFESSIIGAGGKLVHRKQLDHPLFVSFEIYDRDGNNSYSLTVYN